MHNFKKLDVWKTSINLSKDVYFFCSNLPKDEKFGLISQMQRAAVSVASNIAEGSSRSSNKEFIRFVEISLGSLFELETQILITKEVLPDLDIIPLIDKIESLQKQLYSFKNYLGSKS